MKINSRLSFKKSANVTLWGGIPPPMAPHTRSPLLPGAHGTSHYFYLVPAILFYLIPCITVQFILVPPGNYLHGCRTLVHTYSTFLQLILFNKLKSTEKIMSILESCHFIHLHSHSTSYNSLSVLSSFGKDWRQSGHDSIAIQQKLSDCLHLRDFCNSIRVESCRSTKTE